MRLSKQKKTRLLDYATACLRVAVDARRPREYEWYRNLMYYAGFQDIEPDIISGRPVPLPRAAQNRVKNPKVREAVLKYVSKLVSSRPIPRVQPRSNDWQDRDVAKVANGLLLYSWETTRAFAARHSSALDAAIFGNGFLRTQWNLELGAYTEVQDGVERGTEPQMGDDGEPVLVDKPMVVTERPRIVRYRQGMVQTAHVPTLDIFPHPSATEMAPDVCAYYFERKLLLRHQVHRRFPGVDPEHLANFRRATDQFMWSQLDNVMGYDFKRYTWDFSGGEQANVPVEVWDMYHAPITDKDAGVDFENGFRMIFSGDEILEIIPEIPYHSYPCTMFRDRRFPDRFWGTSLVDDIVDKQDVLNAAEDAMAEVGRKIARPPLIRSYGAAEHNFRGRAGEVYDADLGEIEPHPMPMPEVPGMIRELRDISSQDIERLSMVGAPSGGAIPERGSSGAAWDILRDEQGTAMAPTVEGIEAAWGHAAQMALWLIKDHLPIPYVFEIMGPNRELEVVSFDARRITASRARIVPGSMRFTYSSEKAKLLMQLASNGLIPPEKADLVVAEILGEGFAAEYSELEEPAEKALTKSNIARLLRGESPRFGGWLDHAKCIAVLRPVMSTGWFFDLPLTMQGSFEQLLRMHQMALQPNISPAAQPQGGGLSAAQPSGGPSPAPGAGARGTAQVPAADNGYTGPLGPGQKNPLRVIQGQR